ncbi:DUF7501 family protein [Halorarius litoreus]|uniref:DUF7501 family protein n=1 Tax=Halorarius litoreus TaxID=2962676 RepID=UPI0020CCFBCD|nr:hypothetical protein [Halorarius litoreus]
MTRTPSAERASAWNDPDYCPFCGAELTDAGAGFIDHVDANAECGERFEAWLEAIRDDIGGEWGG